MEEKIYVIRTMTDEDGNRPIDVNAEAFICPVCYKEIAWDYDNWVELDDGTYVCEDCWQELDTCAICDEEYFDDDEDVKICSKCAKELAK